MTAWALRFLAVAAGLGVLGGTPVPAVHVPGDVPLSIAPEDVQRLRDAGETVVLIDLRPADAFGRGHAAGARSIPLDELRRRHGEIPRAGRVVLYAKTAREAAPGYQALRDAGFRNVMVLAGGFETWIGLKLPVEPRP
jgi:rhodanese-related sulfurtransferase